MHFFGAAETTSGSCYLLSFGDYQILIDCGLFQGPEELKQRNYGDFPFAPRQIDAVILTHAHIDHCGLLPKLSKLGFSGPIYTTGVTVDLCRIMLADSGYIQETEVERKNRQLRRQGKELLSPIYTVQDAEEVMTQFKRLAYDEEVSILPGLRLRLRDAGHILGASIVELWVTEEEKTLKLVFSGDLGNLNQPIVRDPSFISEAQVLVIESTYGTRLHLDRDARFERLAEAINSTLKRGGNLLIPSFALGRTQDLLYALRILQDEQKVPPLTVFVDSPLASTATEVFQKHAQVFDYQTRSMLEEGRSPFAFPGLKYTESVEDSMAINSISGGAIIIAGSGMADAGRIKHHLKHNLWREQAGVLLVGYQAAGTLGRRLQDGASQVRIHGEPIQVRAQVETITGFSAHGDQEALLGWLSRFRQLGRVFVTHGDLESCRGFAELVAEKFQVPVTVPKLDEVFDLSGKGTISIWEQDYRDLDVEENFSGVLQAASEREINFRAAYGWAQRRYKLKNNFFTAFNLGSGREFFARLALWALKGRGVLSAEDLKENGGLLQGEQALQELRGRPPWEVVKEEVLLPAKLKQTAYYYLDQLPARCASGYTYTRDGQLVENIYAILKEGFQPQLFSTVHDLHRLLSFLAEGGLLSERGLKEFLSPYKQAEDWFELRGTAPGAALFLGGSLESKKSVIVLSNGEEGALGIYRRLVRIARGL